MSRPMAKLRPSLRAHAPGTAFEQERWDIGDAVVVGIDGSANAQRALLLAGRYAARSGAPLLVVHAIGMDPNVENAQLATIFGIDLETQGFIAKGNSYSNMGETTRPGVYVAGAATGPETIDVSGGVVSPSAVWKVQVVPVCGLPGWSVGVVVMVAV